MATTEELPEPPGSGGSYEVAVDARAACWAAAAAAARAAARASALRPRYLALELILHALEPRLEGEHLVLLGGALGDEPGRLLLVGLQLEAAVLDVALVRGDRLDRVHVGVADALHERELCDQLVEARGREEDVDEALGALLVQVDGARLELGVGQPEVVLGHVEQMLVLSDGRLDVGQLGRRHVVFLDGQVGLTVDLTESRADLLELRALLGERSGRDRTGRRDAEEEGDEEEDEERRDPSCACHASPPCGRGARPHVLGEVSPGKASAGLKPGTLASLISVGKRHACVRATDRRPRLTPGRARRQSWCRHDSRRSRSPPIASTPSTL